MSKKPGWGGRRSNQTGRPPKGAAKKIRIGTLFLALDDVARLAAHAEDGETLIEAARRVLIACLSARSDGSTPTDTARPPDPPPPGAAAAPGD